ncbi:MAG: hypothetical protein HWD83_08805 [Gammaproteobacteria bacterium]|nr:hypothetical protein [Gammaproteobacteria bacterium]
MFTKFLAGSAIAMAALSSTVEAQTSTSSVSGSAGLSTAYLLRGLDLDSPQFWGQADYTAGGFTATAWVSSLTSAGYELNVVPKYTFEVSDSVSIDVGAVLYKYEDTDFGDYVDLTAGVGFGNFYLGYMHTVGSDYEDIDWDYVTFSGEFDKFSALVGYDAWDDGVMSGDYIHLDLTYALTDNLSFTVSKIVSESGDYGDSIITNYSDDVRFLVGFSLPISD